MKKWNLPIYDPEVEKIVKLQESKSKLAAEVIAEGDSFSGDLDGDTMLALFD